MDSPNHAVDTERIIALPVWISPHRAGWLAAIGGALWLIATVHAYLAHGFTSVDERNVVIGLTWYDSAKVLFLTPLFFFPAVWVLRRRASLSRIGLQGTVSRSRRSRFSS